MKGIQQGIGVAKKHKYFKFAERCASLNSKDNSKKIGNFGSGVGYLIPPEEPFSMTKHRHFRVIFGVRMPKLGH